MKRFIELDAAPPKIKLMGTSPNTVDVVEWTNPDGRLGYWWRMRDTGTGEVFETKVPPRSAPKQSAGPPPRTRRPGL